MCNAHCMDVLSWQPSDVDGCGGMMGAMAVNGDFEYHISGPWESLSGSWLMAISRTSDPDNRDGLPPGYKFTDRCAAQHAAEVCAAQLG